MFQLCVTQADNVSKSINKLELWVELGCIKSSSSKENGTKPSIFRIWLIFDDFL